jgi:hypothetical protein
LRIKRAGETITKRSRGTGLLREEVEAEEAIKSSMLAEGTMTKRILTNGVSITKVTTTTEEWLLKDKLEWVEAVATKNLSKMMSQVNLRLKREVLRKFSGTTLSLSESRRSTSMKLSPLKDMSTLLKQRRSLSNFPKRISFNPPLSKRRKIKLSSALRFLKRMLGLILLSNLKRLYLLNIKLQNFKRSLRLKFLLLRLWSKVRSSPSNRSIPSMLLKRLQKRIPSIF